MIEDAVVSAKVEDGVCDEKTANFFDFSPVVTFS